MSQALRKFFNHPGLHGALYFSLFFLTLLLMLLLTLITNSARAADIPMAARLDVPFVPTPPEVVDRMLEIADVKPDDYLIDLGSGDGRIVISAVRDRNVKRALGIDLDPQRVSEARDNARRAGVADRAEFRQGDIFEADFSEATVLTMYLLQTVNERLRPTILKELAPGTRIVSHAFDMGGWQPDQTDSVGGRNVYMWIVPARVEGQWQLTTADGEDVPVSLIQAHQKIQGSAMVNGSDTKLQDASLRGNMITFAIGSERYTGTVNGDTIEPMDTGETAPDWQARRLNVS